MTLKMSVTRRSCVLVSMAVVILATVGWRTATATHSRISAAPGGATPISAAVLPSPPVVLKVHTPAEAVAFCTRARRGAYTVTLTGFFRRGLTLNGPVILNGAIFDNDGVPENAGVTPVAFSGITVYVDFVWPLHLPPGFHLIRQHRKLLYTGELGCVHHAPTTLTLERVSRPTVLST
jgi:hypothetical protein